MLVIRLIGRRVHSARKDHNFEISKQMLPIFKLKRSMRSRDQIQDQLYCGILRVPNLHFSVSIHYDETVSNFW